MSPWRVIVDQFMRPIAPRPNGLQPLESGVKQCMKCGVEKDASAFGIVANMTMYRYSSQCKECERLHGRKKYAIARDNKQRRSAN